MYFVPAKFQTQFIVVSRREVVSTVMHFTDLSLGVSAFEALEPMLVCPQTGYTSGKSHVFIQTGQVAHKTSYFHLKTEQLR